MMRVYMQGQAGERPQSRWEGEVISPIFNIPGKDEDYCVVHWDKWTGKDQRAFAPFTDIRRCFDLVEITD